MRLDAEFCESRCPVCVNARKGNRFAKALQRIELFLTEIGRASCRERG